MNSCDSPDEVCDSDGDTIGQESTIFAIFEFISVIGESRKFQRLLPPILSELVYYLIAYMQVTEEQVCVCVCVCICRCCVVSCTPPFSLQVQDWLDDVNQFVEEDENDLSYSGNHNNAL